MTHRHPSSSHDLVSGGLDPSGCTRRLGLLALVALGARLAGCAQVPIGPRHHDISAAQLNASLADRFPLQRKLFDGLDVRLDVPRLSFRAAENRLATVLDLTAQERLITRRPYSGVLGFSSALRYERIDRTVRLAQVKVEQFRLSSLSDSLGLPMARVGAWLAQDLLENFSVYQLPSSVVDLLEGLGVQPQGLAVQDNGLRVLLAPTKA